MTASTITTRRAFAVSSAPLITRLFGPASNVQTDYYNLVNGPLAVCMGLLLGVAPLMRWRKQDPRSLAAAGLGALAGQFGISASVGGAQSPVYFADLLETRSILLPILDMPTTTTLDTVPRPLTSRHSTSSLQQNGQNGRG